MIDALASVFGIFGIFFAVLWIAIVGLMIVGLVFWILMLVDVAKRDFAKPDEKTVWLLVVILAGIIGAIIYYFVVKKKQDS